MGAKMKALEDQQRDSQRHIRVLKDSLVAKEEHYNLLLADVEELRRNLDERNKLIERRSYQTSFHSAASQQQQQQSSGAERQQLLGMQQDLHELQSLLELRDKRIGELQRKVLQLDSLLAERDAQLERARMRLEHSVQASVSAGHPYAQQPDVALVGHLEESLRDKEKQIALLRDQRDRAEHELNEERDSHERTIKEYKMKLNSLRFEMDKLQVSLNLPFHFLPIFPSISTFSLYSSSVAHLIATCACLKSTSFQHKQAAQICLKIRPITVIISLIIIPYCLLR